ncbi:MAG: NAD-dependent DNA ligase LigA, partial [Alloprevotella sp.]|nr:NAD-dependent DNA ligase LigA [Alloprevotella sp.]
ADICGGYTSRVVSARKVVESIDQSRKVPFDRVLYALGIRFVGRVAARQLARAFRTMDALTAASEEELQHVEGVGKIIAKSVVEWFAVPENQAFVQRLREAGLQMEISEEGPTGSALAGKTIVISGTFSHHSREEYKLLIERNGGRNASSISSKTSFVLAGENMGPSKQEKAASLGIALVPEADFLDMIGESPAPSLF